MVLYLRKGLNMTKGIITFAIVGIFVCTQIAQAAMSSSNYEIRWDTVSTGGSDTSNSASYILRDTISPAAGAVGTSTNYQLTDGYRAGLFDQIITFDHYILNQSTQVAATALSGSTVTVASTSGFSVNDYVAIIQDTGSSQVTAIGKISSIGGSTLVCDRLTTSGTTPSLDGSNDYVYRMSASSVDFSSFSTSAISSSILGFEVTADNDNGYTIQVLEDGQLRVSDQTIDDVSDGSVTVASEEYGARSSDTTVTSSTFDTQDTAITSSAQEITTSGSFAFDERSYLALKATISATTSPGVYAQTLTFIVSGNF